MQFDDLRDQKITYGLIENLINGKNHVDCDGIQTFPGAMLFENKKVMELVSRGRRKRRFCATKCRRSCNVYYK